MPENNEILLDLISQNIRIERPNLAEEQIKALASDIKNIFEALNGGVMQLEDATRNIISFCLSLLNKTEDLIKNNKILISSYDTIIEKMDGIATNISNRIKESNALFRQNIEIKNLIDRNLDYVSKLPDKMIKNMENVFERSNTLSSNSVSQNIIRIADKIINSFKLIENFMRNPFKVVKDYILTVKNVDQDFLTTKKENVFDTRKRLLFNKFEEDKFILFIENTYKSLTDNIDNIISNINNKLKYFYDLNIKKIDNIVSNISDKLKNFYDLNTKNINNIINKRNEEQNILIPKKDNVINQKEELIFSKFKEDKFILFIENTYKSLTDNIDNIISNINNKLKYFYDLNIKKIDNIVSNISDKLKSFYDLNTKEITNVITNVNNRLNEKNILAEQNYEPQNITNKNLDYIYKLPNELIKNINTIFDKFGTLSISVLQNISKITDNVLNAFISSKNFIIEHSKIIKDYFLKEKDNNKILVSNNDIFNTKDKKQNILNTNENDIIKKKPITNIINNKIDNKLINEKTLAGITNIPLNEQIVLNKTVSGVATKWLAKRLEKGGLTTGKDTDGGFISNIKDKFLEGIGLAGGMSAASLLPKMLPKLLPTLLNPWVLGGIAAALGGMLLWKFRKPVTEFLGGVKDATGKLVENVKIGVSTKFEEVKDLFISGWESSIESLKTGWGWIIDKWNSVQNIWSNTVDSVKSFWSNIAESASNTYDKTILPLLKNIDNLFSGVFSAGIEEIKKLKPYLDSFTGWMGSFKESIVDFTVSSGNKFLNWIKDLKDSVAPKDLKPGGILGSSIGRDTSEFTKESDVGYKENGINVSSDLESILRRSNIDITKPTLSRVINEEVALQVTYDMLKKAEAGGQYSAVRRNDSGAVSLGVLQWNANRARDYLKNLYKVDPKLFKATMGSQVLSDLKNKDWSNRTFSIEESRNFAKLLEDPKMRAETDRLALQDISKYFKQARELGIEGQRELSLAASMINQYGYAGFKNLLENKLQTTDFDKMVQIIKEDKNFPYRTRRLEEIDQLNNIYKDIKILKEDMSRNINIPETLNSYQQSINSLVVNEIKTGLQNVSENFVKSINDLKTEIKETKNKDDNRGMVEASLRQIDRSYIGNIPKYIMEMMFGLNIGGEDKKLGGIF